MSTPVAACHGCRSFVCQLVRVEYWHVMSNPVALCCTAAQCQDVVEMEKPDEKIVITYVAMIFRALAKFTKSEALVKSIKKVCAHVFGSDPWRGLCVIPSCVIFVHGM